MKSYLGAVFMVAMLHFTSVSQQLQNFNFQAPSIDSQWITNQVYIPAGYDPNSDHQYPILIYLHARDGSGWAPSATSTLLQWAADDLIAAGQIEPIIMIFPWVELTVQDNAANGHFWANSEYFGPISSVITQDLFGWLYREDKMNLKNKVSNHREQIAIGGFGMGADGALRILFNHPDQFMGALANFPDIPVIESPLIAEFMIPLAVQETGQSGPPYNFSLGAGFTTNYLYAISAAWAPLKSGKIQFLLNDDSSIKGDVLKYLVDTADCPTLIVKNKLYTEESNSPCIYFESNESNAPFSDAFIKKLEKSAPSDRFFYKQNSDFVSDSVKVGIKWIVDKMSVTTSIQSLSKHVTIYLVYPNPAKEILNIKVESERNYLLQCEMLDITGKSIYSHLKKVNSGSNHWQLDIQKNLTDGIYLLKLTGLKGKVQTQKIIIKR